MQVGGCCCCMVFSWSNGWGAGPRTACLLSLPAVPAAYVCQCDQPCVPELFYDQSQGPARALPYCGLWHCSAFLPCCSLEHNSLAPHSLCAPVLLPSYSSRAAASHVLSWCQLCHEVMANALKQCDFHWTGKAGKLWCVLWITPWLADEVFGWPSLKSLWLKCCLSFPSELAALIMQNWWEGHVNFGSKCQVRMYPSHKLCLNRETQNQICKLSFSQQSWRYPGKWEAFRTYAFCVCRQFNQTKSFHIFGADNFSHLHTWYARGKLTSESVSSWYL